jgi:hypothetical protein
MDTQTPGRSGRTCPHKRLPVDGHRLQNAGSEGQAGAALSSDLFATHMADQVVAYTLAAVGTHLDAQQTKVADMKLLDQACEAALGPDLTPDNPVTIVPAPPGCAAVGMSPPLMRLRLWQLGFGEEASIKGAAQTAACGSSFAV